MSEQKRNQKKKEQTKILMKNYFSKKLRNSIRPINKRIISKKGLKTFLLMILLSLYNKYSKKFLKNLTGWLCNKI